MTLTTDFGFFSPKVLEDQRGLSTTDEQRARRDAPSPTPPISLVEGGGVLAHLPGMASGWRSGVPSNWSQVTSTKPVPTCLLPM
jgi:hypothetical protein